MILLVASILLSGAPSGCAGTLDATAECTSPRAVPLVVTNDIKTTEAGPARDPAVIPGELGFVGVGVAVLGGGALAATQLEWNGLNADDQRTAKLATTLGGVGALVASGAIFASAGALWVFNPSTGKMRFTIEGD